MTATNYTMPTGRGEQLVKNITVPAGDAALISFTVLAHGDESWFDIHRELSPGLGGTPLEAQIVQSDKTFASSTQTGSNQPHCQHTGAPYQLPNKAIPSLAPGTYTYKLTAPGGKQHTGIVLGRQNGGNVHS